MPESPAARSFDATPRRRQEARDKGSAAFSQDLASAAMLFTAALVVKWMAPAVLNFTTDFLRQQLTSADLTIASRDTVVQHAWNITLGLGVALAPLLILLMLAGILANLFQVGFRFVPEQLQPDWNRVSPANGLERMFSLTSLLRFVFGLLKISVIIAVSAAVAWSHRDAIFHSPALELDQLGRFLFDLSLDAARWITGTLLALALVDYAFQRWKHERDLRMTHEEIREEMKNASGATPIVARRRQAQRNFHEHRRARSL